MNEKHAAITMLLLVWNEPLRTFASHTRLDFALEFFRFGPSLYFFHLREGPCLIPNPHAHERAVSGETYPLHTSFLLLSLYYLGVLPPGFLHTWSIVCIVVFFLAWDVLFGCVI